MPLVVVTAPTADVVTDDELDAHLRLGGDEDEIARARALAEAVVSALEAEGVTLLRTAYTWTVGGGPDGVPTLAALRLPRGPRATVTAVTLADAAGVETALDAGTDYRVSAGGILHHLPGATALTDPAATLTVAFEAGHGASPAAAAATDVPAALREAVLRRTATLYEAREDVAVGTVIGRLDDLTLDLVRPFLPLTA